LHPLVELLHRQQAAGFPDVAGTQVSATFPITDRLLNEVLARQLPPSAAVKDVRVRARAANTFVVNVRLARPAFLPPIGLTLRIARQPIFPNDPELILEVAASALMSLAGPALRSMDVLPPGVRLEGDHIRVNFRTLLEERGLGEAVRFIEDLRVATEDGRVIVSLRARILPLS
jgi:hypothetical protein